MSDAPICEVCGAGQLDGYGDVGPQNIGGITLDAHAGCATDLAMERGEERLVREEER